jgi:excisionase family DNA binding protein
MAEKLISIGTAAERLGVSSYTVRRLIERGELRSVHVGRRVLLPESEINRICQHGCTPGRD